MLVIGRKPGRHLTIGPDPVVVTVLDSGKQGVTLRVDAPNNVQVTETTEPVEEHAIAQREREREGATGTSEEVFHVVPGEGVYIGNGMTVRVVRVEVYERGPYVRLGIDAPRWYAVSRDDIPTSLHMKLQAERKAAFERGEHDGGDRGRAHEGGHVSPAHPDRPRR